MILGRIMADDDAMKNDIIEALASAKIIEIFLTTVRA